MNGPITLFDKSFLQALSVDESVWFDQFFAPLVCPFFFVETLADLAKPARPGRDPLTDVAVLAAKSPQLQGSPCAHHQQLIAANLVGQPVPMDSRIPRAGAKRVVGPDGVGVVYEQSPEDQAFSRWMRGEFHELEHEFARQWRDGLESYDGSEFAALFKRIGIDGASCKSLDEVRALALTVTSPLALASDPLSLALIIAGGDARFRSAVYGRHRALGFPHLSSFAPYAAYAVEVEVFYLLAVAAGLVPRDASSRIDFAYLFYLPFSMLFVSSDDLHRRVAHFFLQGRQRFIWGHDLKADLGKLDRHYERLPDATKEQGVLKFAAYPPQDQAFLVARIFDELLPAWRESASRPATPLTPEATEKLIARMKRFTDASEAGGPPQPGDDERFLSVQRMVSKRKGKWYLVPRDLPDK